MITYDVPGLERQARQALLDRASSQRDYLRIAEKWLTEMQHSRDPNLDWIGQLLLLAAELRRSLGLPPDGPPVE